jgi:hypothetical protein
LRIKRKAQMASDAGSYDIDLRDIEVDDLPIFFEQQLDPDANSMAAFTSKDPTNRDAFMAHWARIIADEAIVIQTILCNEQVAGHVPPLSTRRFWETRGQLLA